MKRFLILLYLSYASSDKLDLTYLPPPGSQYAGGRPEDIQTPLEYPRESYSTTLRPQTVTFGQKLLNSGDRATIGIDRVVPSRVQDNILPQGIDRAIPSQGQNTILSQGIDSAGPPRVQDNILPQGPKIPFNNYQNPYGLPSTTVSYAFTQTTTHPPTESFETTLGPINPITGLPIDAPFNFPSQPSGQIFSGHENQFLPNTPGYQSTPGTVAQFPGSGVSSLEDQFYRQQGLPGKPQFQQEFQSTDSARRPGFLTQSPLQQTQYQGNQSLAEDSHQRPGLISSTTPQRVTSSSFSGVPSDRYSNNAEAFATSIPNVSQTGIFNQSPNVYRPDNVIGSQPNFQTFDDEVSQHNVPGYTGRQQSEIAPNISGPGLGSQTFIPGQFDSSENFRPGSKQNTYPGSVDTINYVNRPERPQAESDRNAVILNYKNIVTPEGFEYSFDTSNGIHADENGTAIDGVKAEGSYSYTGDDGKIYTVVYTADENGFQPHGDHLPTPPPVPEAIQRLIEIAEKEKEAGIYHDGSYDEDKYGDKKYQETNGRYSPGSHRIPIDGANVSEDEGDANIQEGPKKEFIKPQSGFTKLQIDDSATEYSDIGAPQKQNENKKESSSLPANRIPDVNNAAENISRKQFFDNKARPNTNIDGNVNQGGYFSNANRDKQNYENSYPSEENEEDVGEYNSSEDSPENISDKNRLHQKVSQRPSSQQRQHVEQNKSDRGQKPGFRFNQNQNNNNKNDLRPTTGIRKSNIQIMADKNQQRPIDKYSSRRPTDQPEIDDKELESSQYYDEYDNSQTRLPSKYPAGTTESAEDFKSSSEVPSRLRPSVINRPIGQINSNKIVSTRRRPSQPDLTVTEDNQGSIDDFSGDFDVEKGDATDIDSYTTPGYQTTKENYDVSTDFETQDNQRPVTIGPKSFATKYTSSRDRLRKPQPSYENSNNDGLRANNNQNQNKQRPGTVRPQTVGKTPSSSRGNIFKPQLFETESDDDLRNVQNQNQRRPITTGSQTIDDKYSSSRGSPQKPEQSYNYESEDEQRPAQNNQRVVTTRPQNVGTKYSSSRGSLQTPQQSYENASDDERQQDNVQNYGQRLRGKPTSPTKTNVVLNENSKTTFNSTGYQYIPPSKKFNHDEGSYYPVTGLTSTRRPSQKLTYNEIKNPTSRPFMTPNVQRTETQSPVDDYDEEIGSENVKQPNQQEYEEISNGKKYEQNTTPDQIFSDEVISTARHSNRPSLQTTKRPQYNQQYSTTPGYNTTPGSGSQNFLNNNDGTDLDTQSPYGVISSTTRRPLSRPNLRPASQATRRPQYNQQYSTTQRYEPTPGAGPQFFQNNDDGQDLDDQGPNKVYSSTVGRPSGRPNLRPSQTTRRPQYNHQYSTTPGYKTTLVSSPQFSQTDNDEKDLDAQSPYEATSSTTLVPSQRPSYYETTPKEILIPGQKNVYYSGDRNNQKRPIGNGVTSSTQATSQGSLYDGSYPEGTPPDQYQTKYRPTQPTTPTYDGVTATGLPTVGPTGGIESSKPFDRVYGNRLPSTTYRPNYTISATETSSRKPAIQVDTFGRPIVNIEDQRFDQQYRPETDEISSPDGQDTRHQYKQNLNGARPSSNQTPDIQSYQTSTTRVTGEDFSGPKQQQRFDPKLGYYY